MIVPKRVKSCDFIYVHINCLQNLGHEINGNNLCKLLYMTVGTFQEFAESFPKNHLCKEAMNSLKKIVLQSR